MTPEFKNFQAFGSDSAHFCSKHSRPLSLRTSPRFREAAWRNLRQSPLLHLYRCCSRMCRSQKRSIWRRDSIYVCSQVRRITVNVGSFNSSSPCFFSGRLCLRKTSSSEAPAQAFTAEILPAFGVMRNVEHIFIFYDFFYYSILS